MTRYRRTSAVALGAVVLGAAGFAPQISSAAASAPQHLRPAQDSRTVQLLAPDAEDAGSAAPGDAGDAAEEFGAEYVRSHTARIRSDALDVLCKPNAGREISFTLFDDVVVQAVEEGRSVTDGRLVWQGTVAGAVGQDVLIALEGGCDGTAANEYLSAQFLLGGDAYAIEPISPGRVRISQLTPLTDEDESGLTPPPAGIVPPPAGAPRTKAAAGAKPPCKNGKNTALIDVLVGYTPGALKEAGGEKQIRSRVAQAVALTNNAFANSGTKARVRLVRTVPVKVAAAQDAVTNTLLKSIADPRDGAMDELHTLRDSTGADLVSVIAAGRAAGGLGYAPRSPGPSTANYGFSVTGQSAIDRFSFGHELGHNLGASHDRTTQPDQPPPYGANGYFPKSGDWSSLMAYESGCRKSTNGRCNRINYFSNAHMKYRGEPLGVPLGSSNESDTSDVLSGTAKAIAAYRPSKISDALCSVSYGAKPKGSGTVKPGQPGPYPADATSVFTAEAVKGYVFDHWLLNGKRAKGTASGITPPAGSDHTLIAVFRKGTTPTSTVTTNKTGSGTVKKAPATRGTELEGADLLYEAVPAPGWDFSGWRLDGSYAGDDDTVALDVGTNDMVLTAEFEKRRFTLELCAEGGQGTIKTSEPGPYSQGDVVEVTATPKPGYAFADWLLDGKPYGGDEERAKGETAVSFEDGSHTLTAVFRPVG
ncbi:reprolysin-like metallopeptidase [Streptomyces sp. NPDC050504]|uniref:InlB B-repeat-containing protein n=1 Tax=Streptomyces sp. NPDC050504 TaxID=3365618 RepID=UPI0037A67F9C